MKIHVIGAGSWGLALARHLANNQHEVSLWCRSQATAQRIRIAREHAAYLPGVRLPKSIKVTTACLADGEMAVLATPSHALRGVLASFAFAPRTLRLSVIKGIENETLFRMSEVIEEASSGGPVATLSGPTHAEEVARDLPASIVTASLDPEGAQIVQQAFFSPNFRVYTSDDLIGVELGGALKNVIAIAAGACDGLGLGDNAKAALITRGLAEISRLGVACGAQPQTFAGLSGMGDLMVTCGSRHSRNRRLGEALAAGQGLESVEAKSGMIAEGVRTTRSARQLARDMRVETPIIEAVYQVIYENAAPKQALEKLLQRDAKPEYY